MKSNQVLTARQAQALQLLALDLSVEQIADCMNIKKSGVRKHLERTHRMLGVHSAIAAYRQALLRKAIELEHEG